MGWRPEGFQHVILIAAVSRFEHMPDFIAQSFGVSITELKVHLAPWRISLPAGATSAGSVKHRMSDTLSIGHSFQ